MEGLVTFSFFNESLGKLSYRLTDDNIAKSMPLLERFVALLYHRTSNGIDVNSCRRELFCQGRAIDNIPPTQDALHQHVRRAAYIGGYQWGNSLLPKMNLPLFEAYGWNADATPHWTDLP